MSQTGKRVSLTSFNVSSFDKIIADYTKMNLSVLDFILDRFESDICYGWIDTKYNIMEGKDFSDDDEIRGKKAVYGWIQGRALESLACHAKWLSKCGQENKQRIIRIRRALEVLSNNVMRVREKNNGHIFFLMDTDGAPYTIEELSRKKQPYIKSKSPFYISDLFASKGLRAAAHWLDNSSLIGDANDYSLKVLKAVKEGNFENDQQVFNLDNPVSRNNHSSHISYTISIGLALQMLKNDESIGLEKGIDLIEFVINRHLNSNIRFPGSFPYDFAEFFTDDTDVSSELAISDPGHALEFVGLAYKFVHNAKKTNKLTLEQTAKIKEIERILPLILLQNFKNGYQDAGGICKSYNLAKRVPINAEMPWWSLPETLRAAGYCWLYAAKNEKRIFAKIMALCHNSFVSNYLRPDRYFLAVQTRSAAVKAIKSIPATPDFDPGYHTNLCLIDLIEILETEKT